MHQAKIQSSFCYKDLQEAVDDRDRWRESVKKICAVSINACVCVYIYIYIYIVYIYIYIYMFEDLICGTEFYNSFKKMMFINHNENQIIK